MCLFVCLSVTFSIYHISSHVFYNFTYFITSFILNFLWLMVIQCLITMCLFVCHVYVCHISSNILQLCKFLITIYPTICNKNVSRKYDTQISLFGNFVLWMEVGGTFNWIYSTIVHTFYHDLCHMYINVSQKCETKYATLIFPFWGILCYEWGWWNI